jgi:hypothetical protein
MHHRGLLDRIGARLYRFIVVADRARPVTWRRPWPRGGSRSPRPLRCEPGPYPPDGSARVPHPAERACHVRAACTEPAPEDVTLHAGIPIVTVRPGLRSYRGRSGEQLHRSGDRAGQAPWAPGVSRTQCDPGVQTGWDGGPRTKIPCSPKEVCRRRRTASREGRTVHPHMLQNLWITEMLRRGMNPLLLRVIAGTSPVVIALHCEHLTEDDLMQR